MDSTEPFGVGRDDVVLPLNGLAIVERAVSLDSEPKEKQAVQIVPLHPFGDNSIADSSTTQGYVLEGSC